MAVSMLFIGVGMLSLWLATIRLMASPVSDLSVGKRVSQTISVTFCSDSLSDSLRNMNPLSVVTKWKGGGLNGTKKVVMPGIEINLYKDGQIVWLVGWGILTRVMRSWSCSGRMSLMSAQTGFPSLLPLSWSGEGGAMVGGAGRLSILVMVSRSLVSSLRSSILPPYALYVKSFALGSFFHVVTW